MLSAYQEVNDSFPGYDKNLETDKRSVTRCTIPKALRTVPCERLFRVLAPEFEISASGLRTLLSELNVAGAERNTSAPELKISAREIKSQRKKKLAPEL